MAHNLEELVLLILIHDYSSDILETAVRVVSLPSRILEGTHKAPLNGALAPESSKCRKHVAPQGLFWPILADFG